jgi:crotonobetainyl-CoA:carnitine CoA-transferase CaiB-like acyl-CoA transferase
MNFFHQLKVIELATVLAGPAVGQFFAELGAQVLKVENPKTGGDVTRGWKLSSENTNSSLSAYFISINWGKETIALDITKTEERKILYELVKSADIVIVNYKPNDAEKLGVDYQTLKSLNPKILYGHITGYGLDSPKVGYDALIQAEAGFIQMNGHQGGAPTKMPVALVDVLAAHQLKEGILVALLQREKTGEGAYIEVSLFDSAVASLVNQASNWLNTSHLPKKMGNEHPNIVPYGTLFPTKDNKEVILAVGSDKQFQSLCELLNLPELAKLFPTNALRVKNREEVVDALRKSMLNWEKEVLLEALEVRAIPAGGLNNMEDVFKLPLAQKLLLQSPENQIKGVRSFVAKISSIPTLEKLKTPPSLGVE